VSQVEVNDENVKVLILQSSFFPVSDNGQNSMSSVGDELIV
jgi:hypothetical protein